MPVEIQKVPQVEKSLPETVRKITGLYLMDKQKIFVGEKGKEQRNELWRSAASEFSEFSGKITELDEVMKDVDVKKKKFPELTRYSQLFFGHTGQGSVKDFLGDIWCSRVIPSEDFSEIMIPGTQLAKNMLGEMGIETTLCGNPVKKITLELAMSSFLMGNLKIKSAPQKK